MINENFMAQATLLSSNTKSLVFFPIPLNGVRLLEGLEKGGTKTIYCGK